MDPHDPKLKTWGVVLGAVVAMLALVDVVVLRGERVASATVNLQAGSPPALLAITRPGEKHLVEITTRKRVGGETTGQSISYRLVDPDGATVEDDTEILEHERRYFSFHPTRAGSYALHAQETRLLGPGRGTAHVTVTVNDRRVLSRLLGF
jgi:hypothetical protein